MQSFKTTLERLSGDVWACGFFPPKKVVDHFLQSNQKRVVCKINDSVSYQCALMPSARGYFININREFQKKLRIKPGDSFQVELTPDDSEYGLPVPEEFAELLKQDAEGDEIFHSLTRGKQRTLLHLAGKPKSSETRLKKALVIINYLKDVNGKLDLKELNLAFKEANRG